MLGYRIDTSTTSGTFAAPPHASSRKTIVMASAARKKAPDDGEYRREPDGDLDLEAASFDDMAEMMIDALTIPIVDESSTAAIESEPAPASPEKH